MERYDEPRFCWIGRMIGLPRVIYGKIICRYLRQPFFHCFVIIFHFSRRSLSEKIFIKQHLQYQQRGLPYCTCWNHTWYFWICTTNSVIYIYRYYYWHVPKLRTLTWKMTLNCNDFFNTNFTIQNVGHRYWTPVCVRQNVSVPLMILQNMLTTKVRALLCAFTLMFRWQSQLSKFKFTSCLSFNVYNSFNNGKNYVLAFTLLQNIKYV